MKTLGTVLVVDDTFSVVELVCTVLENNYLTLRANNGLEALSILETQKPDLILLDIRMPDLSGFELCSIIKNNSELNDIPIIFLTAYIEEKDKLDGFELGAVDYITKPFDNAELRARVKVHVELYKYQKIFKKRTAEQLIEKEKELEKLNLKLENIVQERTKELLKKNQELAESENKFKIFADHSVAWESLRDNKGNLIILSKAFETITGFSSEDYYSGKIKLVDISHPDRKEFTLNFFNEAVSGKEFGNVILKIISKTGKEKFLSATVHQIYLENGMHYGFRTSIIDVTEKIEAEKLANTFLQAIECSQTSVFILDNEGNINYVNSYFCTLSGYNYKEVLGKKYSFLQGNNIQDKNYNKINEAIFSGNNWNGEVKNRKKDGTIYIERLIIVAVNNEVENLRYFVGVASDITEEVEMEKKILQTIIETEEKERERFARDLHDGIGPLLSAAKLYIQSLANPKSIMDKSETAKSAEELLVEAQNTIRQISFNLSPYILQTAGLIEALQSFAQKIESACNIKINLSTNIYKRFDIETETILYRVLCECINNTIKYAQANIIEINFDFSDNGFIIVYSDNGIGVDFDDLIAKKNGTGFSNIKSRIKIINGLIDIYSKPGKGMKIVIKIIKTT